MWQGLLNNTTNLVLSNEYAAIMKTDNNSIVPKGKYIKILNHQ
jgi:hypothetical protein